MSAEKNKKVMAKSHLDMDEYLPYAAHFDEETVLTKNGELMQTIKVSGFGFELEKELQQQVGSIRDVLRKSLMSHLPGDNFSVWVHTIRRQQDLSGGGISANGFSNKVNEQWIKQNGWRSEYVNELYITITIEGEWMPIKNLKFFVDSLFVGAELNKRRNLLTESARKLSAIVDKVVKDLAVFGARKLSVYKKNGVYYSEPMALFSKIMNLKEEEVPLLPRNLSNVLPTHNVEFLINAVHVEGPTGRHFGAVFSVKQYSEISLAELDKLIQLPINFIIAECFDFVPKELALAEFEDQKKFYELSGSKYMMKASGLNDVYDNIGDGKSTDFVQQQIVITVIEDSIKEMQKSVGQMVDVCRDIGLVIIREDLFVENCYWSMMPANFDFIKRQGYLSIRRSCGFASLANFTTGKLNNNKWGSPVATFRTLENKPYIFNFHNEDTGNTIIVGNDNAQKIALKNFLLSQSQKFSGKTIIVENNDSSKAFVESMMGRYYQGTADNIELENKVSAINTSDKLGALKSISSKLDTELQNVILLGDYISENTDQNFISELIEIIKELNRKNTVVIFSATYLRGAGIFSDEMLGQITNHIFLKDETVSDDILTLFGTKESDMKSIMELDFDNGEILLSRAGESFKLKFKFVEESAEYKILSASQEFINSMSEARPVDNIISGENNLKTSDN